MPWGLVADRLGRRPVFVLGLIGMTLETIWQIAVGWFGDALPIRLYCLGPLAIIIGGGNAVLNGTMCSLMSDVLPEADRAIGFMRVHIASMLGNLCSPMISSVMMPRVGPWPLLWLSVVLGTLPAAGILFVPETLTTKAAATEDHGDLRPDLQFSARLSRSLVELRDSLSMLKNLSVILLLFGSITLTPVILCTLQFLSQYVSKRYHVKLAYTGYVQGAYGGAHILFILFIIPYASKLVLRSNSPKWIRMANEQQRDLAFLKGSFVAVVLGTFVMSVSPSLPVFVCGLFVLALGSGAGSYIPSTLAFYIDKEHRTRMFSLVGIVQVMGSLYAEPMLAGLFTLGMRIGGIWIGLPYLGVAVLCGVAFLLLRFVRLPRECDRGNSEYHRTASDEIETPTVALQRHSDGLSDILPQKFRTGQAIEEVGWLEVDAVANHG
ncbi:hypothetical protein TruAng_010266 [Truncatella angustata]|nr:hypothetical protein TruAng_010266 [Truncatella angustata]